MASRSKEGRGVASETRVYAKMDTKEVDALLAALKAAGNEAKNAVRHDLKAAGKIVVDRIQALTRVYGGRSYSSGRGARRASVEMRSSSGAVKVYKGTHTPGLLKRSTRMKTTSRLEVRIFNNAKAVSRKWPGGYRYGKRLEFDPTFSGQYAFFYKGFDETRERAYALLSDVLDKARKAYLR